MDDIKQVKVDNWGTFFLQRLKHFFNRTDYCDLTLQFQDKAQLKVHRLVLSACTEYFELLERTCEMYEDCLVMPDDLQADVVVPIINFMYTGHLEFSMDILEKLQQTSMVMNMPVLTTLLESHRNPVNTIKPPFNRNFTKHYKPRTNVATSLNAHSPNGRSNKRPYTVAFENANLDLQTNKVVIPSPHNPIPPLNMNRVKMLVNKDPVSKTISVNKFGMSPYYNKRLVRGEAKPTRCELPEELENDDNTFTNSFTNISYESKPLVVHPETKAQAKKKSIFNKASSSKNSSVDMLECKKVPQSCNLFDENPDISDDYEIPQATLTNLHNAPRKSAAQLFDQIVENEENDNFNKPKVTIETSDCKQAANLDHAKIISEVLKKYPHLVNSNKNIKLKVLNPNNNTSPKISTPQGKRKSKSHIASSGEDKIDYIDRDILDTKEAARLIALGVTNVSGPWICLMCGTPSKALRFGSYYYYRRHLVEVHNEKPATRMCEYCGLKTPKRNLLIHHLLTKHGVDPPMQYNFPRCDECNYIGLTEANLVKHKANHNASATFKCNVCNKKFVSTNQLLAHIQQTGHKFTGERKADLKCIYCLRVFIRHGNLYSHIKANHKDNAIRDGVIDDSDEEKDKEEMIIKKEGQSVKHEAYSSDYEEDGQTQEMQQYMPQKLFRKIPAQKILNSDYPQKYQSKTVTKPGTVQIINKQQNLIQEEFTTSSVEDEEMVDIDGEEYYVHNNQLVKYIGSAKKTNNKEEYVLSDMVSSQEYIIQQHDVTNETQYIEQLPTLKKLPNSHQPVQIVVANEEYDTLMSSNATEIFDETTSKTLTVLTTPDTANLAPAGIDIPETVSNSMMILPDDYPLSVTTSDTPIDSNIMVVYTQPAEITSNSYQIITTANGEQYVQTSDVANNIDPLSITAIPNDGVSSQQEHPTEQIEDKNVETVVANTVSEVVDEKETNDILPEVTMPGPLATQTLEVVQDDIEMSQTFTQDETELQDKQEDSNEIHDNEHIEKDTIIAHDESTEHKDVEEENNSADNSHVEHSDTVMEVYENNEIIAYQTDVTETENDAIVTQNDDGLHKQEDVEMAEVNQANEIVPEVVKEKIQTLTSEWSEDETEVVEQEISTQNVTEIPQNHEDNTDNVTEPEDELEESIENIQKVMDKHNMEKDVVLENITEETIVGNTVPSQKNSEEPQVAIEDTEKPPQEKITSLLNDWEDNDSQEEAKGEENGKAEDCHVSEEVQQELEMEHEAPKDDKIKSLVSDWDDDEEEQNE